jgi:uncharacterized protein (TIRG00374 family)
MATTSLEEKKDRKKRFPWFKLLRLAGIILFIIIISQVDVKSIWFEIRKANAWFILFALLFQVLLLLTKGMRWHLLNTSNQSQNIIQSFGEFFESYAIGVITPGRFGELMKAGYQNKREQVIASAIRVGAERGADVGFFVLIAGIALYAGNMVNLSQTAGIITIGFGLLVFMIGVLLVSSKKINQLLDRFITNFSDTFIHRQTSNVFYIICLSVISNVFYFVSCYIVAAYALHLDISLLSTSGGVAVSGLLNMLPVTVMGLGTREMTFLYIFNTYPQNQVLALSGLIFAVAQVGGGLISLLLGQIFLQISKKNTAVENSRRN